MKVSLNLDDPNTWVSDFSKIIYLKENWSYIDSNFKNKDYPWGKILDQFGYRVECIKDNKVLKMTSMANDILKSKYDNVVGYHGCRVSDKKSYLDYGILPSDPQKLIQYAKNLFGESREFENALHELEDTNYISHNENKIGLLLSAKWAKHVNNDHAKGSEFIRAIANRLGTDALKIYFKSGKPTLIKCLIPVDWLDKFTTYSMSNSYSKEVLRQLSMAKLYPEDLEPNITGGFMVTKKIPHENIVEFIDMTDFTS